MLAWTALTKDDLPMPLAPQRRALLAGNPSAKCFVFCKRTRFDPSIPTNMDKPTLLT